MTNTMKRSHCSLPIGFVVSALIGGSAFAETYLGPPMKMGDGEARTFVRTDGGQDATAIGVMFNSGAMSNLPEAGHGGTDVPFTLPMPTTGPKTVVDHVVINWEPHGHQPAHIYDVPHFDFHFYLVNQERRARVSFKDDKESGDPAQQPPAELMAAGYKVPPGTAIPQMGVHAIKLASPEFNGKPFTTTFIYGYHDKELIFIEPMMTVDFLKSKPSFSEPIPQPQKFTFPGRYPASYSVKYDSAADRYEVALDNLK